MTVNIHNLIAAINPDLFCQPIEERNGKRKDLIQEVKRLAEQKGYLAAAAIARVKDCEFMDYDDVKVMNPFALTVFKNPIEKHILVHDLFRENVAVLYFWLLDNLEHHYQDLSSIEKLADNFNFSPGSGQFSDFNSRTMQMQDQAMKLLEAARRIVESIPNLLRELKDIQNQLARQSGEYAQGPDARPNRFPAASENELKKGFEFRRNQLQNQVNLAKAYARWAKPYLQMIRRTEQRATPNAALVNGFNSAIFELVLLVEGKYDLKEEPEMFPKAWLRREFRAYCPILLVEWRFRGVPEHSPPGGNHYRGRSEITFTSYALREQELEWLKAEIERDELGELLRSLADINEENLKHIQEELNQFMDNENPKAEHNSKPATHDDDVNPFSALFSIFSGFDGEKTDASVSVGPDSTAEQVLRNQALLKARKECQKIYELYKREHGMPTFAGANLPL